MGEAVEFDIGDEDDEGENDELGMWYGEGVSDDLGWYLA
jgi:hypothetical protein